MNTTINTALNLTESAPAKINLRLKVTERRADGYHEIETVFLPLAEPADLVELAIVPNSLTFSCSDRELSGEDNLCFKAARLYSDASGISPEWQLHLTKNIPVAAGLGGGSSDAAAVLRILNRRYQIFSKAELAKMALQLGADVPFFLNLRPALATGIGEKIIPLSVVIPPMPLLLVNPGFPISAAWAYRHLNPDLIGPAVPNSENPLADIYNDLEPAALVKFPILVILQELLLECGAKTTCMSGSGPTFFAFFADPEKCQIALETLTVKFPEFRCIQARLLPIADRTVRAK